MITIDEFKEYFEANKGKDDIRAIVGAAPDLTDETVTAYLESDKGRPIVDRYVNKAVRSHDEKLKPEIDRMVKDAAEKAKRESAMTVEDKLQQQMAELQEQIKQRDADLARRDLVSKLHSKAAEMGVPLEIAVDLDNPNLTEDRAMVRMEMYAKQHAAKVSEGVNARLVTGHKPGSGDAPASTSGAFDPNDFSEANLLKVQEWRATEG
jgi:hypothetical protein